MKYRSLDGLNSRCVFLTVVESKIQVPAGYISGEDHLPGLQMAFSLCPHMAEKGEAVISSCSHKGTNSIMGAPSS